MFICLHVCVPVPKLALFLEGLGLSQQDERENVEVPPDLAADQSTPLSRTLGAVLYEQ